MRRGLITGSIVLLAAGVALASCLLVPGRRSHRADVRDTWVIGYYVGYLRDSYPAEDVAWASLTHIAVGMAAPRPDGSLDASFHLGEEGLDWACHAVEQAHRHDRSALLVVGGAHSRDAFASAAAGVRRQRLVREILGVVDRCGFDGVDLDWEPLPAQDGPALLSLARDVRSLRPSLTLTAALSPVNINEPARTIHPWTHDLPGIFDRLNVMTYGMNGGWNGWASWHSSALTGQGARTPMSVESSYQAYTEAGIPPSKLGLGIGFFGTCMQGVTAPRQTARGMRIAGDDNSLSYAKIRQDYARPDMERWDEVARVPYLTSSAPFGPLRCTYLSYEDERSIAEKARFAQEHGLGGTIVWNLNLGHLPDIEEGNQDPLLEAVRRGFLE